MSLVTVPDFLVAGGVILLVLADSDITVGGGHEARESTARPDFGAVPIGTPILAGPATFAGAAFIGFSLLAHGLCDALALAMSTPTL